MKATTHIYRHLPGLQQNECHWKLGQAWSWCWEQQTLPWKSSAQRKHVPMLLLSCEQR